MPGGRCGWWRRRPSNADWSRASAERFCSCTTTSSRQSAVRTHGVVVLPPHLDDHLGLLQRVEDLAVQTFVPQLSVKRLAVPVLPRAAGLDEQRPRADG